MPSIPSFRTPLTSKFGMPPIPRLRTWSLNAGTGRENRRNPSVRQKTFSQRPSQLLVHDRRKAPAVLGSAPPERPPRRPPVDREYVLVQLLAYQACRPRPFQTRHLRQAVPHQALPVLAKPAVSEPPNDPNDELGGVPTPDATKVHRVVAFHKRLNLLRRHHSFGLLGPRPSPDNPDSRPSRPISRWNPPSAQTHVSSNMAGSCLAHLRSSPRAWRNGFIGLTFTAWNMMPDCALASERQASQDAIRTSCARSGSGGSRRARDPTHQGGVRDFRCAALGVPRWVARSRRSDSGERCRESRVVPSRVPGPREHLPVLRTNRRLRARLRQQVDTRRCKRRDECPNGDTKRSAPTHGPRRDLPTPQCAIRTGNVLSARMWLVGPPKIIWRIRLAV